MYYFEVKFYNGFGTSSRILEVHDIQLNTGNAVVRTILDYYNAGYNNIGNLLKRDANCIKKLASEYYEKYCRIHKLKVDSCSLLNQEQLIRYSKDTPVDIHSYTTDFYHYKAAMYTEKYGIISYKITGNSLLYNQNYLNKEFIGGKWKENPCTYQRIVNLDTGEVVSKRLQRLQKNGWDNV